MALDMDSERTTELTTNESRRYTEKVLGGLKDFQRRTAEYAFDRLYGSEDSTQRFLIADEVGLGKTLVAAGVIAQAIDHLRAQGVPRIDVIYICSNQAIARQNVDRIKHRLSIDTRPLAQRITLVPYRLGTLDPSLNLIALTPSTSFGSASAEGVVEERVILFRMLSRAWGDLRPDARRVFQGGLASVARLREYESWYPDIRIDDSIVAQFGKEVGGPDSVLHREFMRVRDHLTAGRDPDAWRIRRRFVSKLRRLLAHSCLDALEPDLVVLDEFQRFRELLNPRTTSGELAKRLFEYEDENTEVRTLLLSATPYKMYTLSHETDDDHHRDFLRTIEFLQGPDGTVAPLEESLRQFRQALPLAASVDEPGPEALRRLSGHRDRVQSELLRVMSRTERRGRASGGDPMLEIAKTTVDVSVEDVEAYLGARQVAAAVNAPGVMEYWKSSPYLLSFMDNYRLFDRLKAVVEVESKGAAAQLVSRGTGLKLDRRAVEDRREIGCGNGRMRELLSGLEDGHLYELLWLPPSLPLYTLGSDFEKARSSTKRLVFSSWTMVPRAIAAMASYTAERQYVPDAERARRYEAQLLGIAVNSYSLFSLLTPSSALADAGDPLHFEPSDAPGLLSAVRERLRPSIEELIRDAPTEGPPQEIWYAVAPLLLSRESPASLRWLQGPPAIGKHDEAGESTLWQALAGRVINGLSDPSSLGRPPRDLLDVMASLATGSPANATLRALSRIMSTSPTDDGLKGQAMRAAHAFRSLFRSPTAEGLLRNVYVPGVSGGERQYWRRVLAYALEGGLAAVLDEFFYVIQESKGGGVGASSLVDELCQAIQIAARPLAISTWESTPDGVVRRPISMRQHFARRYVSDRGGTADQQGGLHLDDIRASFNSPFWPLVLGTTSIGQEGLDFHWYCHAVVHWNLPPNPVDLEQREGRVHRYHGHAIRKNIAQKVGARAIQQARVALSRGERVSPWELAYELAGSEYDGDEGLAPHWVFTEGTARIQRHSPVLPMSWDEHRVDVLRRSLAVYRMVFGQPRQDDLLEFILREVPEGRTESLASALTVDLSPPN